MLLRPLQFHFLQYFTPLTDPQDNLVLLSPEVKVFVQGVGLPLASSRREAVYPSAASSGDFHRRFMSGWGAVLLPHRVLGVWSKAEAQTT